MAKMRPSHALWLVESIESDVSLILRCVKQGCFGNALTVLQKTQGRIQELHDTEDAMQKEYALEKVAVFGTTEIFQQDTKDNDPDPLGGEIKAEVEDSQGVVWRIYSLGSLEKAIEEGYTVYVVSTRRKLGDHDAWWVELVGEENVFLAGEEDVEGSVCDGWRKLYEELVLEWPAFKDRDEYWTGARWALRDHDIKLGVDFFPGGDCPA